MRKYSIGSKLAGAIAALGIGGALWFIGAALLSIRSPLADGSHAAGASSTAWLIMTVAVFVPAFLIGWAIAALTERNRRRRD